MSVSTIGTIGSFIIAALALLYAFFKDGKSSTKDDTMQLARMMTKLDTMGEDLREMSKSLTDIRQRVDESHDKVIIMERDMKTMWSRIDELKAKIDKLERKGG